MIARLQFITHHESIEGHVQQAKDAIHAGVKWIQVRIKDRTDEEITAAISECITVAKDAGATLILNDRVQLAELLSADGVHVGQEDLNPSNARTILGQKIIGGTANTLDQIRRHVSDGVDYVGVGPFRFTGTKKKLSPILGLEGYQSIIQSIRKEEIDIPVIAIGGIDAEDVPSILQTGVHGIAVSGALLKDGVFDLQAFDAFNKKLKR